MTGARILVVEDDSAVAESLERALAAEGHEVTHVSSGEQALSSLAGDGADLMVLDVGLPGLGGLDVARRLRLDGNRLPILMLTARAEVEDRVDGLDAGADDYLTKPYSLAELRARVRALIRRSQSPESGPLSFSDLRLDPDTRTATRGDREFDLSRTEYSLLELFLTHPRQVLTRGQIFESVWGYDFGPDSNSLGVYVGYLRRKTEAGGEPRILQTIRGVGYILREL